MLKNYLLKTLSADTKISIHDSHDGMCAISINKFSGRRLVNHTEVYVEKEQLRKILDAMDQDAKE